MFNNVRKGLKAWVRYDGNNNAVAGSLIFQKDKPKVGKWKEYQDVNLCCPVVTPCPTPSYGDWTLVTDGDGVVLQDGTNRFTFVGPNDSASNGWIYLTRFFPDGADLSIDYNYASFDGIDHDWPVYWYSTTQPAGQPTDLTNRAGGNPDDGTWNITVPTGTWFSIGLYSDDSCCGRGFLDIDVTIDPLTTWTYIADQNLAWPANQNGYSLYTGGWTAYDDGNATDPVNYAGVFKTDNVEDTQFYLSTNGFLYGLINSTNIDGNQQDLYLTPGESLSDGDTQNFWYKNTSDAAKWKTSVLVYCGHCCGPESQATPYSYILNIYRDGNYQYIETRAKINGGGNAGAGGAVGTEDITSQVWQSDIDGITWTYLGYGTVQ